MLIRDERKNVVIAQITQTGHFDEDMYERVMRGASGILTAENHPEWKTRSSIVAGFTKNRKLDERSF